MHNSVELGWLALVGLEEDLLETISAHQLKLEREKAGLDKVGVVICCQHPFRAAVAFIFTNLSQSELQMQSLMSEQQKLKDQINEKAKEYGRLESEDQARTVSLALNGFVLVPVVATYTVEK